MIDTMFRKLEQLDTAAEDLKTQRRDIILALRGLMGSTFTHRGQWYQTYVRNEGQPNEVVRLKKLKSSPKEWCAAAASVGPVQPLDWPTEPEVIETGEVVFG